MVGTEAGVAVGMGEMVAVGATAVMVGGGMPVVATAAAAVMVGGEMPVAATAPAAVMVGGGMPVVATVALGEAGGSEPLARMLPRGGRAVAAALGMRSSCRGVLVPVPGASPLPWPATRFPSGRRRMTLRSGVQRKNFGRAVGRRGAARRVVAVWNRTHPSPWATPTARLHRLA